MNRPDRQRAANPERTPTVSRRNERFASLTADVNVIEEGLASLASDIDAVWLPNR